MLRKSIILCAAIVLAMAFGICSAYAVVDEESTCPKCGTTYAFEYAEFNEYGDVVATHTYVSDTVCRQSTPMVCSKCGYRDVMIEDHAHDCGFIYTEGEYINSTQHRILEQQTCAWCEHVFKNETYGKHTYSWEKNGNKMEYRCSGCGHVAKTDKLANTLTAKGKTVTARYSKLKKKAMTFKRTKVITVSKAQGTLTYTKASGNKKITVNKSTGKITVKKGLKKGTYKVNIKVKAAGNGTYKALVKTVTVTVKVK